MISMHTLFSGQNGFIPDRSSKPLTKWSIIGAPLHQGQTNNPGVQFGPLAIREGGLVEVMECCDILVTDEGNAFTSTEINGFSINDFQPDDYYENIRNSKEVGHSCELLYKKVVEQISLNTVPLVLGGDHSIATGSVMASLTKYPELAVLWVDAHADLNTPDTSPSGNYHGMPLGHLTGLFRKKARGFEWMDNLPRLKPQNLCYIGLRDIDKLEKQNIDHLRIPYFTIHDIEYMGIGKVMDLALKLIDPHRNRPIHLSFDIDSCDPSIAPGTGTKVNGGLTYREANYICHHISSTNRLVSMDLVEVNPHLDEPSDHFYRQRVPINETSSKTVHLALELIASALGKMYISHT